jgi:hypothetical protein
LRDLFDCMPSLRKGMPGIEREVVIELKTHAWVQGRMAWN